MTPKLPFANCDACPLKSRPLVPSTINPGASYTVIAESPGDEEVRQGANLVGSSGNFLWKTLKRGGVTRDQCNLINVVACAPPYIKEKGELIEAAAQQCKNRAYAEIAQCGNKPTLVLGRAARNVIFPEVPHESVTTLNGRWQRIVLQPPTQTVDISTDGGATFDELKFVAGHQNAPTVTFDALSAYHPSFIISRDPNEAKTFLEDAFKFTQGVRRPLPKPEVVIVTELGQIKHLLNASEIAYDIETNQVDMIYDDVLLLVMTSAEEPNRAYIVPGAHPEAPINMLDDTMGDPFWTEFWTKPTIKFVGHNALFDMRFLRWHYRWPVRCDFDTMLAHYALDERSGTHDLKGVSARYLDEPDWEVGLHEHLPSRNGDYGTIPWDVLCEYSSYDSTRTRYLRPVFEKLMCRQGLYDWPFMHEIMGLSSLFIEMEIHGLHVDVDQLTEELHTLRAELKPLIAEFTLQTNGLVTNVRSAQQLASWFYDTLHLPLQVGKNVNPRSTDKLAIENLAGKHPTVDLLRKIRRIQKMLSSYVENLFQCLDMYNDCHPDWKVHGTEITRVVVVKPAVQTIPRADDREEGKYGKRVKKCYSPHPGMKWGVVDLKQAELRVACALSGDKYLKWVYDNDRDLHVENATRLYGPDFTKTQKNLTKMFVFSQLYGGNEYSFAGTAGIPIELAKQMAREMALLMPELNAFRVFIANQMIHQGYVQCRTGQRRRFPFVNDINKEEARKSALHSVVASGAASITNLSAIKVNPVLKSVGGHVLLLVHDAVHFEYPDDPEIEQCAFGAVRNTMLQVGQSLFPEVPWRVTCEVGYRWGEVKEVTYDEANLRFNIPYLEPVAVRRQVIEVPEQLSLLTAGDIV